MRHQLMITVATAALIAGTGLAAAQGNMSREAPSGGANVQQSAPSAPSAGTPSREGSEGKKASQSEEKGTMKNQRAQDGKSGAVGEKSVQGNRNTGDKSAQENRENSKGDKSKSCLLYTSPSPRD